MVLVHSLQDVPTTVIITPADFSVPSRGRVTRVCLAHTHCWVAHARSCSAWALGPGPPAAARHSDARGVLARVVGQRAWRGAFAPVHRTGDATGA